MSEKNNPFGASETAAIFLSIALETALRRAMRQIEGKSDPEIMALIPPEELRKRGLVAQVEGH